MEERPVSGNRRIPGDPAEMVAIIEDAESVIPDRCAVKGAEAVRTRQLTRCARPFWKSEVPSCSRELLSLHQRELEGLAGQITEARRIARRLDRSHRYSRRTVGLLLDAVWRVTNSAEIVTNSLAIHLAGYRTVKKMGRTGTRPDPGESRR